MLNLVQHLHKTIERSWNKFRMTVFILVILNLFQDLVFKQMRSSKNSLSLYIHYPFCKSKCPYCDFNSHVREAIDHKSFLRAYETELQFFSQKLRDKKITTIFFGGGTPSLMPIFLVEGILKKISDLWQVDENCEITLEANPTSFEATKFKDLRLCPLKPLSKITTWKFMLFLCQDILPYFLTKINLRFWHIKKLDKH